MNTTWQAGIEAAHCSHDVDTLKGVRTVVFEDRGVLHGIFVGAGRAVDVSHATIPWCRGIGVVVGDLAALDDHVMGKHAAHGLMEAAADGIIWHREIAPCLGVASMYLSKRFIYTI